MPMLFGAKPLSVEGSLFGDSIFCLKAGFGLVIKNAFYSCGHQSLLSIFICSVI